MQNVSELYEEIVSNENHWFEVGLAIGDSGRLITQANEVIRFGDTSILVDTGGPESAFREDVLFSLSTNHRVFDQNFPTAGGALSGEIDVQMLMPVSEIPRAGRLAPYVRATDGERVSEWIQKGVYFVDTRTVTHNNDGLEILTLHGYDAMLKFEQNYPSDSVHDYPLLDTEVVSFLAESINITVDPRTFERMNKGYELPLPVGYSSREVLQIIAGSYGGNFIISDQGELLLIRLCDLPAETNYLVTRSGDVFVFGVGDEATKILV